MKVILRILGFTFALCSAAHAAPAVYENGELFLSEGILIRENIDAYYKNIRFETLHNGSLRLVSAERREPAIVEEIELTVIETRPAQVELSVHGFKSVPCVDLEPVALSRIGNTFHVIVAETPLDTLVLCAQVLEPFDLTVALDVQDLPAGTYLVHVNGHSIDFELE